jgi:hypothetical protein
MIKLITNEGRVISLEGEPETKKVYYGDTEILKIYVEGSVNGSELAEIRKAFDNSAQLSLILPERENIDAVIPYFSEEFNGIDYDIKINFVQK